MRDIERIEEGEIAIIAGASSAIKEFVFGEMPDEEKIMTHVLQEVEIDRHLQIYIIAGANFALKTKMKDTKKTEKQIMQELSNEIPSMVRKIEENE